MRQREARRIAKAIRVLMRDETDEVANGFHEGMGMLQDLLLAHAREKKKKAERALSKAGRRL